MHKYRSLDAWKRAHTLALRTLNLTDPHIQPRNRFLFDQLRRAAVSVEANLVEGYALGTSALFRRHVRIAIGSAAEAECLVRLIAEAGYMPLEATLELASLCDASIGTLRGLMRRPPPEKV